MINQLFKRLSILLLTKLFINYIVICSENLSEDYGHDQIDRHNNQSQNNVTEKVKSYNTTDHYDYEINDEEQINNSCDKQSFIDKIKLIHEEGKNKTIPKNVKSLNETFDLLKSAQTVFESLFAIDEREKLKALEYLSEIDLGLSQQCLSAFAKVFTAIKEKEFWAIKFLDSMGRFFPPGYLEGILADFGDYDECLDITSPTIDMNTPVIRGQYCLLKVILPFPHQKSVQNEHDLNEPYSLALKYGQKITFNSILKMLNISDGAIYRIGICIPSNCKPFEVENMINKILQPISKLPVEIDPNCHMRDESIKLDNFQIVSITILSILSILVISSTIFEIYKNIQENEKLTVTQNTKTNDILLSFSIIKNTKSLFIKTEKWTTLDTIRLLFIVHIYVIHFYSSMVLLGMVTLKKVLTLIIPRTFDDWRYFFVKSPQTVDSLYTLSGFLISYSILRRLNNRKGRFSYISFILRYWLRFMLLSFGSILFFYLFPLFGDGPVWHYGIGYLTNGCKNPWNLFKMFLFVYNFQDFDFDSFYNKCNNPLSYLSSLFQFLLISPLFVILYYKKPKIGVYAIITAIIFTLFLSISPKLLFGIKPYFHLFTHGIQMLNMDFNIYFTWYHTSPNVNAISYFVGIAFGFLMMKKTSFTQLQQKIFWILSVLSIIIMYLWQYSLFKTGDKENNLSALLWHSIGKLLFSSSFGWIYYEICSGRAEYLNRFLSWSGFQPIARLSFGIYVLHQLTIFRRIFNVKETFVSDDYYRVKHMMIDMMFNILLAYIFYILIECPFGNLSRISFNRRSVQKPFEKTIKTDDCKESIHL